MSLINQMLRDLDARRALAGDRPAIPEAAHAVQQRPQRLRFTIIAIAGVAAAAAVGYWINGSQGPAAPAGQAAAPAATPPAAAPVALQPQSAALPAEKPHAMAVEERAPEKPHAVAVQERAAEKLRAMAAEEAAPAKPPVPPPTKTPTHAASGKVVVAAPTKPAAPAPAPAPARSLAGAPAVAGSAPPAPAAESSIERRVHGASLNEAAENEYQKAVAALRRGADGDAATALQSALRLDPSHVSARQALMSLLVSQKQLAEAQAVATEGLNLDPSQTGWAIVLARLQMENGKLSDASETLARHARYADQNADYQAFSAVLAQKQKRYREAGERYRAALALRPAESRWWYGLGVALEAEQKPQEARAAFLRARDSGNLPAELASAVERRLH